MFYRNGKTWQSGPGQQKEMREGNERLKRDKEKETKGKRQRERDKGHVKKGNEKKDGENVTLI